jgi:hypothetical protein
MAAFGLPLVEIVLFLVCDGLKGSASEPPAGGASRRPRHEHREPQSIKNLGDCSRRVLPNAHGKYCSPLGHAIDANTNSWWRPTVPVNEGVPVRSCQVLRTDVEGAGR